MTLKSLEALAGPARSEVLRLRLEGLQARLEAVQMRLYDLSPNLLEQPDEWVRNSRLTTFLLDDGFQDARRGRLPLRVPWGLRPSFAYAIELEGFLDEAEVVVRDIEARREDAGESPSEQIERLVLERDFRDQLLDHLTRSLAAPRTTGRDPRPQDWHFERVSALGTPKIDGLYHPGGIGLTIFDVPCDVVATATFDDVTTERDAVAVVPDSSSNALPIERSLVVRVDVSIELATDKIVEFGLLGIRRGES